MDEEFCEEKREASDWADWLDLRLNLHSLPETNANLEALDRQERASSLDRTFELGAQGMNARIDKSIRLIPLGTCLAAYERPRIDGFWTK